MIKRLNILIHSEDWEIHDYFQRIIESSNSDLFEISIIKTLTEEERDEHLDLASFDLMLWDLRGPCH